MRYVIAVFFVALFLSPLVRAGDVIQYSDGTQVEAPAGYKAVFVPKGTDKVLIQIQAVELKRPNGTSTPAVSEPYCPGPDELVLGQPDPGCPE